MRKEAMKMSLSQRIRKTHRWILSIVMMMIQLAGTVIFFKIDKHGIATYFLYYWGVKAIVAAIFLISSLNLFSVMTEFLLII